LASATIFAASRGSAATAEHDAKPHTLPATKIDVTSLGAVPDGKTVNTAAIQSAIEQASSAGGGTVVIPRGVFVSGAIFLKPGVNLLLEQDAVLQFSSDPKDFQPKRTRIEGHFENSFTPGLINADQCDGFRLYGGGTLDGAGRPVWDQFWKMRLSAADRGNFSNLSLPRARLCIIENSRGVVVQGIRFKDSQFWNLHLYRCRDLVVDGVYFSVPDDYKQAPSTDGIDVDSCQNVAIRKCTFSVTDDCIALKGSKGPQALEDKDSPPVENVRVEDCWFKRGHAALTCGSEATIVRNVVVENCKVTGAMSVLNFKLRPDTPQLYEDVHYKDIMVDNAAGSILTMAPWKQFVAKEDSASPSSEVRNITLTRISGHYGSLGAVQGIQGKTKIGQMEFRDCDLKLARPKLKGADANAVRLETVTINGEPAIN
jgi:alpha-L-rhamnosidase